MQNVAKAMHSYLSVQLDCRCMTTEDISADTVFHSQSFTLQARMRIIYSIAFVTGQQSANILFCRLEKCLQKVH